MPWGSRRTALLLAVLVAIAPTRLAAQHAVQPATFSDTRLANGLRVIIVEDHFAPVFTFFVHYNVGSRDERKGRTGFAHLFEHMMFKGSENVGDGEHGITISNVGGSMNGTTNKDRTVYFETLPSNQLDLAVFLEADRMRSLEISQEKLDNQRNAVQEERRRNLDNQAYGRTNDALSTLVYDTSGYAHPTIGSMDDLNAATLQDVRDFFKTYYAPNNAVIVIVGDVDAAVALQKVRKAFESIPSQPPPPKVDLAEPPRTAERRHVIEDALARTPRLDIVYKVPPRFAADDEAVLALSAVLGSGRSSRLSKRLMTDEQLVASVFAARDGVMGPGMFRIIATLAPGKSVDAVEKAIYEEIEKIKTGPIADWEVDKARNEGRRSVVGEMTSSLQRAFQIASFATTFGDPRLVNDRLPRFARVTAADLQKAAVAYLTPENRTVVTTTPARPAPKAAGAQVEKGDQR